MDKGEYVSMNKKKSIALQGVLLLAFSACSHQKKEQTINTSQPTNIQTNHHTIGIRAQTHKNPKNIQVQSPPSTALSHQKQKSHPHIISKKIKQGILSPDRLDFIVENKTGKTIYVCCFAYMRKLPLTQWNWRKSFVYEVKAQDSVIVHLPKVREADDRKNTFGILGVFEDFKEATDSTYELLPDENKIDLDLLEELHGKKVTIEIEKYGFKKPFYDYDFVKTDSKKTELPSLNFFVKNETGKPIYVTSFIYMKKAKGRWVAAIDDKDDMTVWRFDKTNIVQLEPNQTGTIEVESNDAERDRDYMLAFLGVFTNFEKTLAEQSTYELLAPENKLHLGPLKDVAGKTIALEVEQYGIAGDIVDYVVKEPHRIDFTKVAR